LRLVIYVLLDRLLCRQFWLQDHGQNLLKQLLLLQGVVLLTQLVTKRVKHVLLVQPVHQVLQTQLVLVLVNMFLAPHA
jgi:hypothetical protein